MIVGLSLPLLLNIGAFLLASEEEVSDLIDLIYEAAFAPENYQRVIESIGREIGATSGTSLWFSQSGLQLTRADIWNVADEALRDYQLHYLPFCPRFRASLNLNAGVIYNDEAQRSSSRVLDREYYDFVDRHDIGKANIALIERSDDLTIGLNFYCSARSSFSDQSEHLLTTLMPHLRRATHLTSKYLKVIERADFAAALFDAQTAAITLDSAGDVVSVNQVAEVTLNLKDGLRLEGRRLVASSASDNNALREEISHVLSVSPLARPETGQPLLLRRPSGLAPYCIQVNPLHRKNRFAQEVALLTLTEAPPRLQLTHLKTEFGLTTAETEVVTMLRSGLGPDQIADRRRTSIQTVRSQIKSIYSKTGARSQLELMAMLSG